MKNKTTTEDKSITYTPHIEEYSLINDFNYSLASEVFCALENRAPGDNFYSELDDKFKHFKLLSRPILVGVAFTVLPVLKLIDLGIDVKDYMKWLLEDIKYKKDLKENPYNPEDFGFKKPEDISVERFKPLNGQELKEKSLELIESMRKSSVPFENNDINKVSKDNLTKKVK